MYGLVGKKNHWEAFFFNKKGSVPALLTHSDKNVGSTFGSNPFGPPHPTWLSALENQLGGTGWFCQISPCWVRVSPTGFLPFGSITIPCFWIVPPNVGFMNHQNTPNWSKPNSTRIIPHDHNFQTRCCCCCFGVGGHVAHAFQVALFSEISIPGFPDCFPQSRFCESPKHSKLIKSQFNPVQSSWP